MKPQGKARATPETDLYENTAERNEILPLRGVFLIPQPFSEPIMTPFWKYFCTKG